MAAPAIVLEELGYLIGSVESEVVAILMACTLLSLSFSISFLFLSRPHLTVRCPANGRPAFKG
jgi:hypothetical protein